MSKLDERNEIVMQFGILLQPFARLADAATPPALNRYREARGQFNAGMDPWYEGVRKWCVAGEGNYEAEAREIRDPLVRMLNTVHNILSCKYEPAKAQETMRTALASARSEFSATVNQVPFEVEPVLSEANTPFTVYLRIRDLIGTAIERIHYFDRYLNSAFFPLYLRNLNRDIEICLVTPHGTSGARRFGVLDVEAASRLAAAEFKRFGLIEVSQHDVHGRHLRIDDTIFSLGSGTDRTPVCLHMFEHYLL